LSHLIFLKDPRKLVVFLLKMQSLSLVFFWHRQRIGRKALGGIDRHQATNPNKQED